MAAARRRPWDCASLNVAPDAQFRPAHGAQHLPRTFRGARLGSAAAARLEGLDRQHLPAWRPRAKAAGGTRVGDPEGRTARFSGCTEMEHLSCHRSLRGRSRRFCRGTKRHRLCCQPAGAEPALTSSGRQCSSGISALPGAGCRAGPQRSEGRGCHAGLKAGPGSGSKPELCGRRSCPRPSLGR